MALITCSECGRGVSSQAAACPQCGAPIGSEGAHTPLSTIQQTSKHLKVHVIISSLMFWIGIIWFFVAAGSGDGEQMAAGVGGLLLFLVGLVWLVATKIRIWWHHK